MEIFISTDLSVAVGVLQPKRLRSCSSFCYKKIISLVPQVPLVPQKLPKRNLINKFP
jgi:hypothetical protein